jgi:nitrogenase-stabilizing/protective protein
MSELLKQLNTLSAAEEFLNFFGVVYDQAVVHVNRLHILKRFHQYLRNTPGFAKLDATAQFETGRALLTRAYEDFVRSTPAKEKVFKVFQDMDGQHVGLDKLRATLPLRRPGV